MFDCVIWEIQRTNRVPGLEYLLGMGPWLCWRSKKVVGRAPAVVVGLVYILHTVSRKGGIQSAFPGLVCDDQGERKWCLIVPVWGG